MGYEDHANLLVHLFENEHGKRLLKNKDSRSRLQFVEDCIRMVGVFERMSEPVSFYEDNYFHEVVFGLQATLLGIRNGEELLWVRDVNADDIKVIAAELKTNMSLFGLFLSNCQICDEEARHLSDGLRENSTLLYLEIGNHEIGPVGARYLSDMLRENCTLMYLGFSGNPIGNDGARHLSDALRQNSTLLSLDISGRFFGGDNPIAIRGARHLLDALILHNCTLLYLFFSENNINKKRLEDQINNEMKSRTSSIDFKKRSFDECRTFLQEYPKDSAGLAGPVTSLISIPSSSALSSSTSALSACIDDKESSMSFSSTNAALSATFSSSMPSSSDHMIVCNEGAVSSLDDEYRGILKKRGGNIFRRWKDRFVSVSLRGFSYFSDSSQNEEKAYIPLSHLMLTKLEPKYGDSSFTVWELPEELSISPLKLFFRACSPSEAQKWVDRIESFVRHRLRLIESRKMIEQTAKIPDQ